MEKNRKAQDYWRANITLIRNLLLIWLAVSYVAAILLANPLYGIKIGQIPLSFWFAQQGSMIVFVILIFVYAWKMDRIDQEHDVHE
jgi:putative solute:sodium symporter small subunit